MPRNARCILPGLSYHVTQRGTNREQVFFTAADRRMYLALLRDNMADCDVKILAYCLMPNHVHLIAVPGRYDSLALLLRRVHGRYAQAVNALRGRSGHLWQNRFYSCPLSERHLWVALRYVEQNPVRATMVSQPEEYQWSSADAHLCGSDKSGVLDIEFWEHSGGVSRWKEMHESADLGEQAHFLRRCTYSGRPFGGDDFVSRMEETFQRKWRRLGAEKRAAAEQKQPLGTEPSASFA